MTATGSDEIRPDAIDLPPTASIQVRWPEQPTD